MSVTLVVGVGGDSGEREGPRTTSHRQIDAQHALLAKGRDGSTGRRVGPLA